MIQDAPQILATLPEARDLINNLLILLSPKEKLIIENRYSLNQKNHATLEKIGKDFGVTRERIRQIEKNALKKLARNVVNTRLHPLNQFALTIIQKYDGIVKEDKMVSELLMLINSPSEVDVSAVKLSLELDSNVEKVPNTIHLYPYFKLKTMDRKLVNEVCDRVIEYLRKKGTVESMDTLISALDSAFSQKTTKQFIVSALELDRRIKLVKKGVGLAEWRDINPRTLRDKIHFILNDTQKPLHYVEIANRIAEGRFDTKAINVQAVHNELIRDQSFVLIGRGIYALRTWGYEDGTVAQVIATILKGKGPLDREAIIQEVLKKRHVKRITILLNLKNKPIFQRVGREVYSLKA